MSTGTGCEANRRLTERMELVKETRRVVSDSVMAQASSVWFWDQVLKSLTKTQQSKKSSAGPSAGDFARKE